MQTLDADSIDAVVTDPPYFLGEIPNGSKDEFGRTAGERQQRGFMGQSWDNDVAFQPDLWRQVLRVLKPGGHLLAMGGTRTFHRLVTAIETAGFEIRDSLAWLHAQGFPKGNDVSKQIDKRLGGAPATPEAEQWQGWNPTLKPAMELIVLARKPFAGTVAENVLAYGTGALNIDACRVPTNGESVPFFRTDGKQKFVSRGEQRVKQAGTSTAGRWPANVIHDGSDDVLALFPQTRAPMPCLTTRSPDSGSRNDYNAFAGQPEVMIGYGDAGSAARVFFCAKAGPAERADGKHPTVKPLNLMRYLCTLITPPGGTILDPFAGSGSTGVAATELGFEFLGIELRPDYAALASRRMRP